MIERSGEIKERNKKHLIRLIRFWGIFFILTVGLIIISIDILDAFIGMNRQSEKMRNAYIQNQKKLIKNEVSRVVALINYKRSQSESETRKKIKKRVYEAYAIASNIYKENRIIRTGREIQKMIIDALRPIRFEKGTGYYFATDFYGIEILFADKPELEGKNLLGMQDTGGKFVIRDMIRLAKEKQEGYYEYFWTKPAVKGNNYRKLSFIKHFEPFDWFIGTGLYVEDVENRIKTDLLDTISKIRFGKEGYIFINRYNGDALVSNGQFIGGNKKLWEVFNKNPEKSKEIFRKELKAIQNPEGDYIYYTLRKLSSPDTDSPKTSFIYGIPELKWIIGAGVYLDDVEADIAILRQKLEHEIQVKLAYPVIAILVVLMVFLLLFNWLTNRLKRDLSLFELFFKRASSGHQEIDRNRVNFVELENLAREANGMLDQLQKSETQLRTLTETIPDLVWLKDPNGVYMFCNLRFERFFGASESEILGKTDYDFVDKELADFFREHDRKAMEAGGPSMNEEEVVYADDGHRELLETVKTPIYGKDGTLIGILGIARDITRRKENEDRLKESEKKFRDLFNENPLSLWEVDLTNLKTLLNERYQSGDAISLELFDRDPALFEMAIDSIRLTNINTATLKLLKFNNKLDLMRRIRSILNNKSKDLFKKTFVSIARNERSFTEETELIRADGKLINVIIQYRVTDSFKKTIVSITDISDQKRAEEELNKIQMLKSVGTLAGGIAHDFNNILMGIFGNISMAKMKIDPQHPGFRFIADAEKSMSRATSLTKQLLTFSKGGAPMKEDISLSQLAEEVVRFDLSGSNVKPVFKYDEDLWYAIVDKGQIQQVLSNLTINANQAMPDGGHLYLTIENVELKSGRISNLPSGKYLKIVIQDEGVGIAVKHMGRIFEPYFSTKEKGSGLGLAMVFSIITKHGGHIAVDSVFAKGTTFTIYLPASDSKQEVVLDKESIQPSDPNRDIRILLMDDDEEVLDVTSQMIEVLGYSVVSVREGQKAIDMYKESIDRGERFDLVIMDLTIPGGLGGKEAIIELKKIDPNIRAIVSSGYAEDEVMADYTSYGFKGIMAKPYVMESLKKVIHDVLQVVPSKSV